jgi:arylsulfatase A-like enzyme
MNRRWPFTILIWLLGLVTLATEVEPRPSPIPIRPNLLVIVLDDTGVEKLSVYSPPVPTPPTPVLTQIAQSGVRFTNAYSDPLCSPTRATVMTGRYGFRTGFGTNGNYSLPSSEVSLAELLKNGFPGQPNLYRCGAFGKWHLTTPGDFTHAVSQGFDQFAGPMENVNNHFDWDLVRADAMGFTITTVGSPTGPFDESTFTASVVRQEALAWINAQAQPFCAYIGFNPPHAPFQVPPLTTVSDATQAQITGLGYAPGDNLDRTPDDQLAYDWLVEAVDTEIGRLINGIAPATRANTTILIVGDNGTPQPVIQVPPYQTQHAKGTVYQQGTLVPLVAAGRLVNAGGLTSTGLVNTVDVWLTIAALADAQLPSGVMIDGVSFGHLLRDPALASARAAAFVQRYSPLGPYVPNPNEPPPGVVSHLRGMNDGTYKYLRFGTATPMERAFDLSADPLERNDLWPILNTLPLDVQARILGLKDQMINLSGF